MQLVSRQTEQEGCCFWSHLRLAVHWNQHETHAKTEVNVTYTWICFVCCSGASPLTGITKWAMAGPMGQTLAMLVFNSLIILVRNCQLHVALWHLSKSTNSMNKQKAILLILKKLFSQRTLTQLWHTYVLNRIKCADTISKCKCSAIVHL